MERLSPGSTVSWADVKRASQEAGSHFLDDETMRFFNSRLNGRLVWSEGHGAWHGVVSTRYGYHGAQRYYEVLRIMPTGEVLRYRGEPGGPASCLAGSRYASRRSALAVCEDLADGHDGALNHDGRNYGPDDFTWR